MANQSSEDATAVKVESSTDENNINPVEQPSHNRRDRDSSGGERFGRGGRFGGRGGGGSNDFRRGRGGYRGGRGGPREGRDDQNSEHGDRDPNENGGGTRDGGRGRFGMRGPDDKFNERMHQLAGPTFDIPPITMAEKKFNGRNRLYIGNIGNEVTEEDITELFKTYGETSEIFINKDKNFGFIKLDYHFNAEKAKRELDGTILKSRNLKIRFAPNSASVKLKNLTPFVTNELLHYAFSVFGEIERSIVNVDDRGKPTGEGIIDFARKGSALHAIRRCSDGCFFLTGSLRPCIIEAHDIVDDIDGYSDKNLPKKSMDYHKEREIGPRFAGPGSFEHEYGMRWKQLHDLMSQKEEALKKEIELEKEKLEAQMEYARYEHETEMLRDQLRVREMEKERQKREWELKQRMVEEEKLRAEEHMRRSQEAMESRIIKQQEDLRRRQQENKLFMQAQNLDSLLEHQEQVYEPPTGYSTTEKEDGPVDPKSFMSSYERPSPRYEGRENSRGTPTNQGSGGGSSSRGVWITDTRHDDYQSKRRRY